MTGVASRALQLANRTVAPLDRLAAARGEPAAPVFVVGLPRSGTTLAYELLVQAFDVAYLTRIYSYSYGLPNLTTRLVSRLTRHPAARYESRYGRIPGRFAPAEGAVLWKRWLPELAELGHYHPPERLAPGAPEEAGSMVASMTTIAGRPFVFKNVYATLSLPALGRLLPRARFIVVQRDIRAVLASIFKGRQESSGSAWWSIRPPFAAEMERSVVLEQVAFQACRSQQLLDRALRSLPNDRVLAVDYADLCRSPRDFVSAAANIAGDALRARPDAAIPQHFSPSPGPGLPPDREAEAERLIEALESSAGDYEARVDARVRELAADD
jgi:hypothetical protein